MKPSERHKIEQTKQEYPPGTRLELKEMDDPYAPVQPGTRGTVVAVDDMGSICMKWDNGRTLSVIPGVDQFRKLTDQEIQQEQEIQITSIRVESLRTNPQQEGFVLQGCGGDLRKWVTAVNEALTQQGILKDGSKFQSVQTFRHGNLTNLVFPFDENVKMDMGRLAIWRIQSHSHLGSTWLSDYVENRLGGYAPEQRQGPSQNRQKPDCPLIGQDGNIFNLMGIASQTLRENGMSEEAKQMQKEITQCKSYGAALNVIGQYVNITSAHEEEDWDESMRMD